MATEAQRRANAKYRAANLEKCRERSRLANKRRYENDEKYRAHCINKTRPAVHQPISQIVEDTLKG